MSDRLALHASQEEIEEFFGVSTHREDFFEPNYNIDPGTLLPVVYEEEEERQIYTFQWGLIPPDADSQEEGKEHYVVKAEELTGESWLEECLQNRRCIVPANGFYKWKASKKKNTPFYIRLLSNRVAGFAGIYSTWQSARGRDVYSFAIITTQANALVQPVDDRMPVILHPGDYEVWLSKENRDISTLQGLLKPLSLSEMAVNRVSEKVNDVSNNGPEVIQPIPK